MQPTARKENVTSKVNTQKLTGIFKKKKKNCPLHPQIHHIAKAIITPNDMVMFLFEYLKLESSKTALG